MVIHRSRGANDRHTLVSVMRDEYGASVSPVNRLDRQTSGVVLMARDTDSARELSEAFANRTVAKTYEAVVRGWPPLQPEEEFLIERPLSGKPAQTRVELLTKTALDVQLGRHPTTRLARLRLYPRSGIHHQIRRHLRGWGYPIINDRKHGDDKLNPAFHQQYGIKRMLLHSRKLTFPFRGDSITVEANWNGRTLGLLEFLGLAY